MYISSDLLTAVQTEVNQYEAAQANPELRAQMETGIKKKFRETQQLFRSSVRPVVAGQQKLQSQAPLPPAPAVLLQLAPAEVRASTASALRPVGNLHMAGRGRRSLDRYRQEMESNQPCFSSEENLKRRIFVGLY